jgi:hypothetical protein
MQTEKAKSSTAPHPLRLLAAWPEADGRRLDHHLYPLKAQWKVSVDVTRPNQLDIKQGYYHILCLACEDFARYTHEARQSMLQKVNLLLLLPGFLHVSQAQDWAVYNPWISFSSSTDFPTTIDFIRSVVERLLLGDPLISAIAHAGKQLLPLDSHPFIVIDSSDQAIWPASRTLHPKAANKQTSNDLPVANLSGVPNLIINNAFWGPVSLGGDQVNINRYSQTPDKITQISLGDQININRQQKLGDSGNPSTE